MSAFTFTNSSSPEVLTWAPTNYRACGIRKCLDRAVSNISSGIRFLHTETNEERSHPIQVPILQMRDLEQNWKRIYAKLCLSWYLHLVRLDGRHLNGPAESVLCGLLSRTLNSWSILGCFFSQVYGQGIALKSYQSGLNSSLPIWPIWPWAKLLTSLTLSLFL